MEWLSQNKDWIFSGVGVFFLGLVFAFFQKSKGKKRIKQKQKSGSNSTNIQIGGDYKA